MIVSLIVTRRGAGPQTKTYPAGLDVVVTIGARVEAASEGDYMLMISSVGAENRMPIYALVASGSQLEHRHVHRAISCFRRE